MAEKSYVVTAACAVVYNSDRSAAVTVAKGGAVPPGVDPEHLRLLVDRGMVEEREFTGGLDVDPDVAPPFHAPDEAETRHARKQTAARES